MRRLAIGARKILAADDVERCGPLGGGDAELGRCRRVVSEHEQQLGFGLGGEAGGRARGAEGEEIVDDANLLGAGRRWFEVLLKRDIAAAAIHHLRATITRELNAACLPASTPSPRHNNPD